ncbi:MAG: M48 family metallopeptidase [Patescibacteria group bacterium]|nr:M48 family metallopeptidase [Patescibacteria group bacterium]
MKSAYSIVAENNFRTIFLIAVFSGLVLAIGYLIAYFSENRIFFWISVIFGLGINLLAMLAGDSAILALSGAKKVERSDMPEIYEMVDNLAITAGLPKTPELYVIDSPALNAFATGKTPKKSYVVLTTGIIGRLNKAELEGVIAHEISHIKNYDIRVMMIATILAGVVAIMADMFLRLSIFSSGDEKKHNGILVVIGMLLAFFAPIFAQLIQLAISRKREYMADASAALLTRNPEALASALEKISNYSPELQTSPAIASLFIVNPFKDKKGFINWLGSLFSTHPPVEERIRILRGMVSG